MSIVECDIDFQNTAEPHIFAVLANRFEGDTLCYSFENNQHLIKTSVILQDAIKYNHAVITKIYNILIWDNTYPLFRDTIQLLFDARVKAKEDANDILAEILKLIMNGGYGKFSQKIHDEDEIITDDVTDMESIYIQYQANVIHDTTLQNGYQCAIKFKSNPKHVKFPVHLSAFILSYSQKRMNYIVNEANGFTNWDNTFYYADTDSLMLHHRYSRSITQ